MEGGLVGVGVGITGGQGGEARLVGAGGQPDARIQHGFEHPLSPARIEVSL